MTWIFETEEPHSCTPPSEDSDRDGGTIRGKGSLWECDDCGQQWAVTAVALRDDADGSEEWHCGVYSWSQYFGPED